MGPDRDQHIRNVAIVLALAVVVWQVPGGDSAGITIANILSLIFVGGLLFLGFRLYMENRETIFGLEERQRGVLYAGAAADRASRWSRPGGCGTPAASARSCG